MSNERQKLEKCLKQQLEKIRDTANKALEKLPDLSDSELITYFESGYTDDFVDTICKQINSYEDIIQDEHIA